MKNDVSRISNKILPFHCDYQASSHINISINVDAPWSKLSAGAYKHRNMCSPLQCYIMWTPKMI